MLHFYDGTDHVGEFRGAGETAILDGLHPSGKLYTNSNEGQFAEIEYSDIKWPSGWKQRESSRKYFKSNYGTVEGGLLDLAKLKNLHPHPSKDGALQAQCPACAEDDGIDNSGNHLIIYEGGEGPFGCAVNQSAEHYSRIFELAKRDDLDERRKPLTPNEVFAELFPQQVKDHGEPFSCIFKERKWTGKDGEARAAKIWTPTAINERFFASLLISEANDRDPAVFDIDENRWLRYDPDQGYYTPVKAEALLEVLDKWLLLVAQKCEHLLVDTEPLKFRFRSLKNLAAIVTRASGLATITSEFWQRPELMLPVANGVLDIAEMRLLPHAEKYHFRGVLEVSFVPGATCPQWVALLNRALPEDDVELTQRWFGLLLMGYNLAQKLLMLMGAPESGKGVIARVATGLVGPENVGTLRTNQLEGRFEIGRLRHKLLIYGGDVAANFMSTPGAVVLKTITGEDPVSPEYKNSNATPAAEPIYGSVLLTANSRLRLRFEGDQAAWRRRIVAILFEREGVSEKDQIPRLAEHLLRPEGAGILNWALEGTRKLMQAGGKLLLNERQKKVRDDLIVESESYVQFAKEAIEKTKTSSLTGEETYHAYVRYCHDRDWTPLPPHKFGTAFKQTVADLYGVSQSNDLRGGTRRGWRGITLKRQFESEQED